MKNLKLPLIVMIIATLILSSCTHRVLDFTLVSTKNVDLSKGASFKRGDKRVTGEDMVHIIIIIPTGSVSIKEAVDRAIESTPGCVALLDGVIYTKFWFFPYIYGQSAAIIEGTPLIDPSIAGIQEKIPAYGKVEINRNGEVKKIENISPSEYYAFKTKVIKHSKETLFENSSKVD